LPHLEAGWQEVCLLVFRTSSDMMKFQPFPTHTSGFVESTLNQGVSKRFCQRQPMQWSPKGAHLLLKTRVKTLRSELVWAFRHLHPDFPVEEGEARAA
jgi:hypothetical protein